MAAEVGGDEGVSRAVRSDSAQAEAEILCAGHVSLSLRRRAPCRPSRGIYGDRCPCSLQANAGIQRAAPDGLGRIRLASRARRHARKYPPSDYYQAECRQLPPADKTVGL